MKRVDKCIGVDGVERNWDVIEKEYYKDICAEGGKGYKTPIQRTYTLMDEYTQPEEQEIIQYLANYFETIILASPKRLYRIINFFDFLGYNEIIRRNNYSLGKSIEWAFRYNEFRSHELVKLAEKINVKTCLYCNSQYTLVVDKYTKGNKKVVKFQFDHFFPKSKYPYLSISLYNLIPSCASCNLSKSADTYSLKDFVHPYDRDFHTLTSFGIPLKESLRLLNGEKVPDNEIKIVLSNSTTDVNVRNYESNFHLSGIYNRHKDIVKEIYKKSNMYINGGKEALSSLQDKDKKTFFRNEEKIEQLILANYRDTEDINKRPLSKFMQDIAKEAGLIKR